MPLKLTLIYHILRCSSTFNSICHGKINSLSYNVYVLKLPHLSLPIELPTMSQGARGHFYKRARPFMAVIFELGQGHHSQLRGHRGNGRGGRGEIWSLVGTVSFAI